jgi:hypothetical protein
MNNPKDPKIANRESWLKVFVIGGFSALIAWKVLSAPIAFNLSDFSFTDLLNLLLAFFAIALSVAFYFKTTDTSNQFYDNTYKFTKEFSEILGRIEAGFGERLKHLDEGYTRLGERFDKLPFDSKKAEHEIKEEEKQVEKKEQERQQIIEDLARRAKLQEHEKTRLFEQLNRKDEELSSAKRELNFLRNRLEHSQPSGDLAELPQHFIEYLRSFFIPNLDPIVAREAPIRILQRNIEEMKEKLPRGFLLECQKFGLMTEEGILTPKGVRIIRYFAQIGSSKSV